MDLSILATEVKDEVTRGMTKAYTYVKKSRLHDCDDSALLQIQEEYVLLGVFDGVSGHAFARTASETALKTVQEYVAKNFKKKTPDELLDGALQEANFAVQRGGTTATIALVLHNGEFYFASIGDSHIYLWGSPGIRRLTREERDSATLTSYLSHRMIVTQCLGGLIHTIDHGHGQLEKGGLLLAFTDGFVDNFYIQTEGGRVVDTSGKADLERLLKGKKDTKEVVQTLAQEIKLRMQRTEEHIREDGILVPKEDDAAIAILKY